MIARKNFDGKAPGVALPRRTRIAAMLLVGAMPLLLGARGDGCSSSSRSPAPDVSGDWQITYDDVIDVEVRIGGATYNGQLSAAGGVIDLEHDGKPFSIELDCSRPEIICPSEAWPETITVEQRNETFEHRMIVTLPLQTCDGTLVRPSSCGEGTLNPDCEDVCDGTVGIREVERFGVIGESGDSFRLYLGAGIATNGINCALLGVSLVDATLDNTGSADEGSWRTEAMSAGLITVGYAGGCVWAGNTDADPELEALLIGASVKFTTGFTGARN